MTGLRQGLRAWRLRRALGSRLTSDGPWITAAGPGLEDDLEIWRADGELNAADPDYTRVTSRRTASLHEWTLKSSDGASKLVYFKDTPSGSWVLAKIGVANHRRRAGVGTEMVGLVFHLVPGVTEWNLRLTTTDGYAFAHTLERNFPCMTFTRNGRLAGPAEV